MTANPTFLTRRRWLAGGLAVAGGIPQAASASGSRDPLSVEGFGALPGLADNTLAVERAIAAARLQGRPVLLERRYRSRSLEIPSGAVIGPFGRDGMLDIVDDGSPEGRALVLDGVETVRFEGVSILSTNAASRSGVYGNVVIRGGSENVVFQGCDFGRSSSTAIWAGGASRNIHISACRVHDTLADGIHVSRGCEDVLVEGCEFWNCGDDAVAFVGYLDEGGRARGPLRNCRAVGNRIRDSVGAGSGIAFLGVHGGEARGNDIRNTWLNGVTVSAVGAGPVGAQTHYCRDIVIRDNRIEAVSAGGSGFGVSIQNARGVQLFDNQVSGAASHAVNVAGVAVELTVRGGRYHSRSGRGFDHAQQASSDPRLVGALRAPDERPSAWAVSRDLTLEAEFLSDRTDAVRIVGARERPIAGVRIGGDLGVASGTDADGFEGGHLAAPHVSATCRRTGQGPLSTGFGFRLAACPGARLEGASAVGVGDSGLGLLAGCTGVQVRNCAFQDNTAFGVFDDGTATGSAIDNRLGGNGRRYYQGGGGLRFAAS